MDPFSSVGFATLLATGMITTAGHKVTESLAELGKRFISLVRRKSPDAASTIEKVAQSPELSIQNAEQFGLKQLIEKVEAIAASDAQVQQLAQEIQGQFQSQSGGVVNLGPLAEKIGVVNQGTVVGQTNHISMGGDG